MLLMVLGVKVVKDYDVCCDNVGVLGVGCWVWEG
jgi:hypothetical protein